MSEQTGIEWTDHTFNPWWGCEAVSPGCAHCYAETLAKRRAPGQSLWGADHGFRFFGDKHWAEPLKWNRNAERDGVRRRVFCASMADVFEEHPSLTDGPEREQTPGVRYPMGPRTRLFNLIAETSNLDWQILTKRPAFARDWLLAFYADPEGGLDIFENVWVGVSIENARHTWRADVLRQIPAAVRFISAEPLLGSLYPEGLRPCSSCGFPMRSPAEVPLCGDCREYGPPEKRRIWQRAQPLDLSGVDWLIVGGESGPGARPMHLQWARELVAACRTASVAPFVKQLGAKPVHSVSVVINGHENAISVQLRDRKGGDWTEWPADLRVREMPTVRA